MMRYGTISFRAPKIWELVAQNIKESSTVNKFKSSIKQWKSVGCTRRLCKTYIPGLQFCAIIIETIAKNGVVLNCHKQFKTLFKDHMVRLKIISLYIYKDLRLKT